MCEIEYKKGVVHARVGQIVLVCDESKTKSVRPTEARTEGRTEAMAALG